VINGIKDRFDQLNDFHANLEQINVDAIGGKTVYTGEIFYKKPHNIRLVYSNKSRKIVNQIAITDGKYLWIYTAELKQITRQKFDPKSLPLPLLVLGGASQIDEKFRDKNYIKPIERVELNGQKVLSIIVKPKNKNMDYQEQTLWVDAVTYLPLKAEVKDTQGNVATVTFSKPQLDTDLKDSLFIMEKIKGVQEIDMVK
jgi:outer membrane lipoprotein-sorting protein